MRTSYDCPSAFSTVMHLALPHSLCNLLKWLHRQMHYFNWRGRERESHHQSGRMRQQSGALWWIGGGRGVCCQPSTRMDPDLVVGKTRGRVFVSVCEVKTGKRGTVFISQLWIVWNSWTINLMNNDNKEKDVRRPSFFQTSQAQMKGWLPHVFIYFF